MLIKVDLSNLEWRAAVFLSQDKVGMKELLEGLDQHTHNQNSFGLPSRLIAKVFVFRLIYGGGAYSYAHDPDFAEVGFSEKQWQRVIDMFYEKYVDLAAYHINLVREVNATGKLLIPTGREYQFKQYPNFRGELEWPRTQILNYPVQGFSADLMKIFRIAVYNRIKRQFPEDKVKFIATVHDDLEIDVANDEEMVYNICTVLEQTCKDIPALYEKYFKQVFNVPMAGEVFYGSSLADMTQFHLGEAICFSQKQ